MRAVGSFLFYSFYLLAAELPLLLILLLRSNQNIELYNMLKITLLISIGINILIFLSLIIWKSHSDFKEELNDSHQDLSNNSISDFFSFFLLPFFTFSLSTSSENSFIYIELLILFFLLNIFLFRTKKLTSNVLIFMFFNIYSSTTKGKNLTLLTFSPLTFDDFSSGSEVLEINRNFYIYYGEKKRPFKLAISITVVGLTILFFGILRYL